MDPLTIIAAISTAIKVGSLAVQLGHDIAPFAKAIYDTIAGKVVTQADLDALKARIKALSDELQLPLAPEPV